MTSPPSIVGPARRLEPTDPDWPSVLAALEKPPARLFLAGALPGDRAIAVVGTRRASREGRSIARAVGRALAREDCWVISGAAHGIDGEAHLGALDDARERGVPARTLAVLAAPLDAPYPKSHLPLLRDVVRLGGGVLTEAPSGARTFLSSFLDRNRIVAALAKAVIVMESPVRSGTLSTVRHARTLGRPVFAVPWSPLDEGRAGGVALLVSGVARACRDASDALDALGWERATNDSPIVAVEGPAGAVLDAIRAGAEHLDQVVERTGIGVAAASAAIVELTLEGHLVAAGSWYVASTR